MERFILKNLISLWTLRNPIYHEWSSQQARDMGKSGCCGLAAEQLLFWGTSIFNLRPSIDWTRPTTALQRNVSDLLKLCWFKFWSHLTEKMVVVPSRLVLKVDTISLPNRHTVINVPGKISKLGALWGSGANCGSHLKKDPLCHCSGHHYFAALCFCMYKIILYTPEALQGFGDFGSL